MSLKIPFVPKSDVKQWFTTTTYGSDMDVLLTCNMLFSPRRLWTSESDVGGRQILTSKVDPRI